MSLNDDTPPHEAVFESVLSKLLEVWWPRVGNNALKPRAQLAAAEVRTIQDRVTKASLALGGWFKSVSWFNELADGWLDLTRPEPQRTPGSWDDVKAKADADLKADPQPGEREAFDELVKLAP